MISDTKKIAIIGAGLGGLSAACLLATKGHDVTVFEKNSTPGGKINQIEAKGFRFDTGPSLLTMPDVLKELFNRCGESLEDYVTLHSLATICRYFYPDGKIFNCYHQPKKTVAEVERIAPADVRAYQQFLNYAEALYSKTKDAFLFNPLYELADIHSLNLSDVFKIDAFKTVSGRVDSIFESGYMRQFFKRFTTYNGSSPFQAPATLNVIPHVELAMGGYYVKGGIYKLVEALMQLATNLGVTFYFDAEVQAIEIQNKKVEGVKTSEETFRADLIISNSDATETYLNLIPKNDVNFIKRKRMQNIEPSCSGLVLLLGINKQYDQLSHHNIFFSSDYKKEFDAIFNKKVMPKEPTIYIADTSQKDPEHAIPGGSNLFVLVNAPYLSPSWDWKNQKNAYSDFVIQQLAERGLRGLSDSIIYQHQITPVDFYNHYKSNRGSIYGTSSNSKMAAFLRPKNKVRHIKGLYLVGGSTHPGGGIPLVILSAFHAVELIRRYEFN